MDNASLLLPGWRESFETSGKLRMHVIEAGPESGRPVVLLHGFPEFWYGWRKQIEQLAAAGFRVIVPDQRGYNLTDKPPNVSDYCLDLLVDDVLGLLNNRGYEQAAIVGHDWGAGVAWWMAIRNPERVSRAVTFQVPHPIVMRKAVFTKPAQMRRSWYMFVLQLPWLPEKMVSLQGFRGMAEELAKTSKPGSFSPDDLVAYRAAWSQPGAMRTMIHWYRAMMRCPTQRVPSLRVKVPMLLIWGENDKYVCADLASPSIDMCDQGRFEPIVGATHWVHHEEPLRVNQLLVDYLSQGQGV